MHCLNEQFTALSLFGQFEYIKIKTIRKEEKKNERPEQVLQFQFILLKLKLGLGWKEFVSKFGGRFFIHLNTRKVLIFILLSAYSETKVNLNLENFSDTREKLRADSVLVECFFSSLSSFLHDVAKFSRFAGGKNGLQIQIFSR